MSLESIKRCPKGTYTYRVVELRGDTRNILWLAMSESEAIDMMNAMRTTSYKKSRLSVEEI